MARWRDVKQGNVKSTLDNNKSLTASTSCHASLILRFKAFITDTFMITMPLMYIVFYFVMGSREEFALNRLMGWFYIFAPHFSIIVTFWLLKQQTPGLKAYDLILIDSKTQQTPSTLSLITRYAFTSISVLLILPLFIPYFNKNKKTLQDIISGTCIQNINNKTKEENKKDLKK